jgi:tyrosyl-tRNA synthetase
MILKKRLAREIITQLYDPNAANKAEENFAKVFQEKEIPDNIRAVSTNENTPDVRQLIVDGDLVGSMSEATRLIKQGAVKIGGERVTSFRWPVHDGDTMQVGKLRWLEIRMVPPTIPGT